MVDDLFKRTELLIGKDKLEVLKNKKIALVGLGGVGSYVLEGLARTGILNFILVDFDKIDITNINRQILATINVIGEYKVDVAKKRLEQINPNIVVEIYKEFIGKEENIVLFNKLKNVDYIIDAIDTVSAKIRLIEFANDNNIPIISALGTGNKLDPTKLELDDIYNTKVCPLAKVIRKEIKKRNIKKLDVVYSKEEPIKIEKNNKEKIIGSISYVPSIAGLLISYKVITNLLK